MYNSFQSEYHGNPLVMTQVLPNSLEGIKSEKHDNTLILTEVIVSVWDLRFRIVMTSVLLHPSKAISNYLDQYSKDHVNSLILTQVLPNPLEWITIQNLTKSLF